MCLKPKERRFFGGKYSARCGARPGARPLDPARFFVKKRGKKLLSASPCSSLARTTKIVVNSQRI